MAMDIRKIKKLIELIKEQNINEIEISEGEDSVRISQFAAQNFSSISAPVNYQIPQLSSAHASNLHDYSCGQKKENELLANKAQHTITSPMVGTLYLKPNPNAAPFVAVGDIIKIGLPLCTIEAMKMFNQIESDKDGKIIKCCVEDGQPVEYGQELFIIE